MAGVAYFAVTEPLLVRAARLEPTERTPVWFMRQAGRSLPEYREIRKTHTLFEVCCEPELCAEVTLQPVRRHDVDAAVMFADIMLPLLGMGVEVELVENVGPVIERPIRSRADVDAADACPSRRSRCRSSSRRSRSCAASCAPTRPWSASAAGRSPSPATWSRASRAATS